MVFESKSDLKGEQIKVVHSARRKNGQYAEDVVKTLILMSSLQVYQPIYSELPLNGHPSKMDTTFGPGCLYIILP